MAVIAYVWAKAFIAMLRGHASSENQSKDQRIPNVKLHVKCWEINNR